MLADAQRFLHLHPQVTPIDDPVELLRDLTGNVKDLLGYLKRNKDKLPVEIYDNAVAFFE